jgi:exodeoxyribonuclease VII small subunit
MANKTDPPEPAEQPKLTFEQALGKLEEIVTRIESGKVPLEKSIEQYAEGIELIEQCRCILDSAEQKIQLLTQAKGDTLQPDGELPEPDAADPDSQDDND